MSHSYSPDHLNVRPSTICRPSMLIARDRNNSICSFGKSVPTIPTRLTVVSKLAATDAYEAEPPSSSWCSSSFVLRLAMAMEPTIRTDINSLMKARPFSISKSNGTQNLKIASFERIQFLLNLIVLVLIVGPKLFIEPATKAFFPAFERERPRIVNNFAASASPGYEFSSFLSCFIQSHAPLRLPEESLDTRGIGADIPIPKSERSDRVRSKLARDTSIRLSSPSGGTSW